MTHLNNNKNIKVSICCFTYNQEDYIATAIDNFINQKVNFLYEIIIHDDASNDNTSKIISRYHKKYPNLIVPIIEKENQYSKNPNSIVTVSMEKARGKYIALCDGDDAWTDVNKLQTQVDFMEKNPNITLCTHNTTIVDRSGNFIEDFGITKKGQITIYDLLEGTSLIHTSSMLFRKKNVEKLPKYYYKATVADLPLKLYLLSQGDGYHIDKNMSFYRSNAKGSWSESQKLDKNKLKNNHDMTIEIYKGFNEETSKKYNKYIENKILTIDFNYYKNENNLKEIKKDKYKKLYKNLSFIEKIKIRIKNIKFLYKLYSKLKR